MPEETVAAPTSAALNGASPDAPFDIEDIIAEATPQIRSVRICVKGDLRERHEELEERLKSVSERRDRGGESLGESGDVSVLVREVEAAEAEIERHMRRFAFHSIGPNWNIIRAKYENAQGVVEDVAPWAAETVAACSVSPKMTAEQVRRLFQKIGQGDADVLFHTARRANFETTVEVPKSRLASLNREGRSSEQS